MPRTKTTGFVPGHKYTGFVPETMMLASCPIVLMLASFLEAVVLAVMSSTLQDHKISVTLVSCFVQCLYFDAESIFIFLEMNISISL